MNDIACVAASAAADNETRIVANSSIRLIEKRLAASDEAAGEAP